MMLSDKNDCPRIPVLVFPKNIDSFSGTKYQDKQRYGRQSHCHWRFDPDLAVDTESKMIQRIGTLCIKIKI
jgi:hypothetical protein